MNETYEWFVQVCTCEENEVVGMEMAACQEDSFCKTIDGVTNLWQCSSGTQARSFKKKLPGIRVFNRRIGSTDKGALKDVTLT